MEVRSINLIPLQTMWNLTDFTMKKRVYPAYPNAYRITLKSDIYSTDLKCLYFSMHREVTDHRIILKVTSV